MQPESYGLTLADPSRPEAGWRAVARAAKACVKPDCPHLQPCPDHPNVAWEGSRRRERLRTRSGSQQQKLRRFVLHRDENTCHVCGHQFPDAQLVNDHVTPVVEGGDDDLDNMAACCLDCHRTKTAEEAKRGRNR